MIPPIIPLMIPPTASRTPLTPGAAQSANALTIEIGGVALECLAARALWWPQERTLFIADVHLGKAESFRSLGVPVPAGLQGPTAATLVRLDQLLSQRPASRLVVLGDLLHARAAQSDAVMSPLAAWRTRHAALEILLLRGNHDGHAGDPPPSLGMSILTEPARLGPWSLRHEPRHGWTGRHGSHALPEGIALSGHLHPVIQLTGRAGDRARLPCFCVADDEIVLPAFGAFTGGAPVQRHPGRRFVAIAQDRLFALA
jgi:DNA ligase-associated metallophosphoesterase